MDKLLTIKNLCLSIKSTDKEILKNINFDISNSEIVSLIGSNGAGKSTLLMTISGVNKAKNGEIIFKGREGEKAGRLTECSMGGNWLDASPDDFFKGKRVVLFSLPGAFTPTCSSQQLPEFENNCERFKKLGID